MGDIAGYVVLGLLGGILSGLLGIGGAIILVPALIYVFGFDQQTAQGTTLAMLVPPTGLLAVMQYYKTGHIDFKVAAILCIGVFLGAYFGGWLATQVSAITLKRTFGVLLLVVGVKMLIGK
jgi:uncharacterized membrane protein YfcA